MLHCLVSLFSLTSYKKIFIAPAGRKCYSFNTQFSVFIGQHAAIIFHVRVCEAKISICNRWELEEFKTTCKLVFNRFWKPLVSSFSVQTKANKTLPHLNVSRSEQQQQQQKNFSTLKYTFLIQTGLIIFVFFCLPFKQFISSWSLWGNSTHPEWVRVDVLLNTVIEFNRKRE